MPFTQMWTSMGQEEETAIRKKAFADYQVNSELMAEAPSMLEFCIVFLL